MQTHNYQASSAPLNPYIDCNLVSATAGPLAEVDAAFFARMAIELSALPSLQDLAAKNSNPSTQRILIHLVCAAMAAFDLSPYTLPLPELPALVDTLVHLYEGAQLTLCNALSTERLNFTMQLPMSYYTADANIIF